MTRADLGHPHIGWARGTTDADKARCREIVRGGCELNRSEEELAMALSMIGGPPRRLANAGRIVGAEAVAGALTECHGDPLRKVAA